MAPVPAAPTVDNDRIAQLKFSDPDLWAALYADDDEEYLPMPAQSQSYVGEDAPVSFDFDSVSSAPPEGNRATFPATVSRE